MAITPHLRARANRLRLLAQQTAVFDADCGDWTGASCGYWWRKLRLLRILAQINKKINGAYFFLMAMAMVRCGRMAVLLAPPWDVFSPQKSLLDNSRKAGGKNTTPSRKDCHGQIKKFKFQIRKIKTSFVAAYCGYWTNCGYWTGFRFQE